MTIVYQPVLYNYLFICSFYFRANFTLLLNFPCSNCIKSVGKLRESKEVQRILENFATKAKEGNYALEVNSPSIKSRNKKVVAKTFHKIGIVVPLDKNGVGYRDLQISNGKNDIHVHSKTEASPQIEKYKTNQLQLEQLENSRYRSK